MPVPQEPNVTVSKTPLSHLQSQRLTQNHVQPSSECSARATKLPFSLRLCRSRIANVVKIVHGEVRSCYGRIDALLGNRTRWDRVGAPDGLDLGPICVRGSNGHRQYNTEPLARNAGIENISAKYPWLSYGDELLILEGWELGKQFAIGNACTPRVDTAEP
jgi:hypothetical protein